MHSFNGERAASSAGRLPQVSEFTFPGDRVVGDLPLDDIFPGDPCKGESLMGEDFAGDPWLGHRFKRLCGVLGATRWWKDALALLSTPDALPGAPSVPLPL